MVWTYVFIQSFWRLCGNSGKLRLSVFHGDIDSAVSNAPFYSVDSISESNNRGSWYCDLGNGVVFPLHIGVCRNDNVKKGIPFNIIISYQYQVSCSEWNVPFWICRTFVSYIFWFDSFWKMLAFQSFSFSSFMWFLFYFRGLLNYFM